MKKYLNFLIGLSIIYSASAYATPGLVCPSTITCSAVDWGVKYCTNMPTEWYVGTTTIDRSIKDNIKFDLNFTGAQIDADTVANCTYSLLGPGKPEFTVALMVWGLLPNTDPSQAWKTVPYDPYQVYLEYCFSDFMTSKIKRDPAYCHFVPDANYKP